MCNQNINHSFHPPWCQNIKHGKYVHLACCQMKTDRSLSEKYASDNSCEIYINNHCLLLQAKECKHPCHLEAYFEEVNTKKKSKMNMQRATLFLCSMILYVDVCLSQRDCTGVDCPVLQNCIENVLEKGACCPKCIQNGCTCEGYQYYDCVKAGFRDGKVPEGKSYFVDFGSTECSCPQGGGKISCHFIPCPEISPNCIDILQPADGCLQCGRIGCAHGNKKYKAGHSFQIDHCQVCHCPDEGGRLMCSPIPGCDHRSVNKPMSVTTTENNNPLRDFRGNRNSQQTSLAEPFSKLVRENTLPLYKQDPPSFGTEDYDYTLAEPTSSTIQNLAQSLESTTLPPAYPESSSTSLSSHDERRHRLQEESPNTQRSTEDEVTHNMDPTTTGGENKTSSPKATTATQIVTTGHHRPQQETGERPMKHGSHRNRAGQDTLRDTARTARTNSRPFGHNRQSHGDPRSVSNKGHEKAVEHRQLIGKEERQLYPTVQFSPTRRAPVRMREEGEEHQRQPQTLSSYQTRDAEAYTESKLTYKAQF